MGERGSNVQPGEMRWIPTRMKRKRRTSGEERERAERKTARRDEGAVRESRQDRSIAGRLTTGHIPGQNHPTR